MSAVRTIAAIEGCLRGRLHVRAASVEQHPGSLENDRKPEPTTAEYLETTT